MAGSNAAVVLFSGGLDSTMCLYLARETYDRVTALTFDYSPRQTVELDAARKVAGIAPVEHFVLPVNLYRHLAENAQAFGLNERSRKDLFSGFLPGRNVIFFVYAAAFAYRRGVTDIICGMFPGDHRVPDCRLETIRQLEKVLNLALGDTFTLHMPFMTKSKAEGIVFMKERNNLDVLGWTHTCMRGTYPPCGLCMPCLGRKVAFQEAGIPDPLLERVRESDYLTDREVWDLLKGLLF